MNTKLFDIQTTIRAEFNGTKLEEVKITAAKSNRSKIWHIIVQNDFNPGVARFGSRGDTPTTIILHPYPGYEESGLVVQMAYAAACLTQIKDFTLLFDDPRGNGPAALENLPGVIGFKINDSTIYEFQKLYVSYMAGETLQGLAHELSSGVNYNALCNWRAEAEEALRRLRFTGKKLNAGEFIAITEAAKLVSRYTKEAQTIRQIQATANDELRQKIDTFAATIKASGPIPSLISRYYELLSTIEAEQIIRQDCVNSFTKPWEEIQEAMRVIRANTPPVPPTSR